MNLDILKQQIEILKLDMNQQGSRMQKDMEALVSGMTQVIQALDRRIAAIENRLKLETTSPDKIRVETAPREGKEL